MSYFSLDFYVKMGIIELNWGGQYSLVLARRSCLQHLLNVNKKSKVIMVCEIWGE